jgi:hypothetical protein
MFRRLTTAAPAAGPNDDTPLDEAGNRPSPSDIMQFMSQAYAAYAASGLRYWSRTMDVWAKAILPIASGVAEMSAGDAGRPEARAALIDELRACLRELTEMPQQEARRLEAELEKIAGALRPEPDGRYWRRWKAKP